MNKSEEITISKLEYKMLLDDARILQCLRNQGVDNWDGWDGAMDEYHSVEDES